MNYEITNKNLPKKVIICECWGRDGIQNYGSFIPTEEKVEMLEKIAEVGFKRVEVTSFSHPKYVPQFADAELVLQKLTMKKDTTYKATCINRKALERAIEAKKLGYGPNEVSFVIAAGNEYNQVNALTDKNTLLNEIKDMVQIAQKENFEILISISTAFGYKNSDDVSSQEVYNIIEDFVSYGITKFMIADTTGIANPIMVNRLFRKILNDYPDLIFIAHFHDTKGWGIANALSALLAGVTYFDTSLGGTGGPPYKRIQGNKGFTGNICTEDFVLLLESLGISTNLNIEKLIEAGKYSEHLLGQQNSKIIKSS